MEDLFELVNEDIFEPEHMEQVTAVVWWLVSLLGGKVVFPLTKEFWDQNYPADTRLVLRKENGNLVLVAEKKDWT